MYRHDCIMECSKSIVCSDSSTPKSFRSVSKKLSDALDESNCPCSSDKDLKLKRPQDLSPETLLKSPKHRNKQ